MGGNNETPDFALLKLTLTQLDTGELKPAVVVDSAFNQFEKHVQHAMIHGWVQALQAYQELLYSGQADNLVFETLTIHQEAPAPTEQHYTPTPVPTGESLPI